MTEIRPPLPDSRRSIVREAVRWTLAAAILWFLGSRLAQDWPTVRPALGQLRWEWALASLLPGVAYFLFRITAWRSVLVSLNVRPKWSAAGRIWMNGEIIRYIPGNLWSIVGRVAQYGSLGTSRTTVFASMVIETLVLLLGSVGVSAIGLLPYAAFDFPGRTWGLIAIAAISALAISRRPLRLLVRFIERVLRRREPIALTGPVFRAYALMILSWVAFALFQLMMTISVNVSIDGSDAVAMCGVFTLSWLLGYVSFLTPSGLGVREAALVWLLRPYVDTGTAVLIAVVSRVAMMIVEVGVLAVFHMKKTRESGA